MNPETIIAELRGINAWRRGGEEIEQPDPKHIGEVLDAAAESLRSLIASNTTLRRERDEARAEVGQLKAALALGQENCDAEYDTLREERDEARAELARVTAEREAEFRRSDSELAAAAPADPFPCRSDPLRKGTDYKAAPANQGGESPMSRDKILAKLPRMSAACLRANGLTQPPAVDMSHDPHDVAPAKKPTLRQDRRGMNKTEAAFLAHLKAAHPGDFIFREGIGIRIGNGCVYWPDFVVESEWADGVTVYEVKGFMRDDAAVKIKAAASRFPSFKFFLVHRDKSAPSGWRIEEVLS